MSEKNHNDITATIDGVRLRATKAQYPKLKYAKINAEDDANKQFVMFIIEVNLKFKFIDNIVRCVIFRE